MNLKITGNLTDVANSAWISAPGETRAGERTDDEVDEVIDFLIENLHTSPFESVTMTFSWGRDEAVVGMDSYLHNKFSRVELTGGVYTMTMDLWNFAKTSLLSERKGGHSSLSAWQLFVEDSPALAAKVEKFDLFGQKVDNQIDASERLGEHNMEVELVSYHDAGSESQSRATWRIKCPLSIAIQILGHSTCSANMTSERIGIVPQDFISKFDDTSEIFGKVMGHTIGDSACSSIMLDIYRSSVAAVFEEYLRLMKSSRIAKKDGIISNDEHKRLREVARYILPEGRITELYISFYIDDFKGYLNLKDSTHAQIEHQWIAQQMRGAIGEEHNIKID